MDHMRIAGDKADAAQVKPTTDQARAEESDSAWSIVGAVKTSLVHRPKSTSNLNTAGPGPTETSTPAGLRLVTSAATSVARKIRRPQSLPLRRYFDDLE